MAKIKKLMLTRQSIKILSESEVRMIKGGVRLEPNGEPRLANRFFDSGAVCTG